MDSERLAEALRNYQAYPSPPSRIGSGAGEAAPAAPPPNGWRNWRSYAGPHVAQGLESVAGFMIPDAMALPRGLQRMGKGMRGFDPAEIGLGGMAVVLGAAEFAGGKMAGSVAKALKPGRIVPAPDYRAGLGNIDEQMRGVKAGEKARPATQTTEKFYIPGQDGSDMLKRAQEGLHLHPTRAGTIAGAPKTFKGADDIEAARRESDGYVEAGAGQRKWYDEAEQAIAKYSPTENTRLQVGSGMGWMSPNSSPDFATQNTAGMMFNLAGGHAAKTSGLGRDGRRFLSQWPNAGAPARGVSTAPGNPFLSNIPTGPKTGPYTNYLLGNPEIRTVNDLWRGRAQGYPEGASEGSFKYSDHNYMWGEGALATARANAARLGGVADWTPARVQAAEWVGKRVSVLKAERDARIAAINDRPTLPPLMPGQKRAADAPKNGMTADAKAKKIAMESTDEQLLQMANEPIGNTLEGRVVNLAAEGAPGRGLKHHEGVLSADEATQHTYGKERLDPFMTTGNEGNGIKPGYDRMYTALGVPQRPVATARGEFTAPGSDIVENQYVRVAGPVVPISGKKGGISPRANGLMRALETTRSALLGQHFVGGFRVSPISEKAARGSGLTGLLYTGDQAAAAQAAMKKLGLDAVDGGGGRVSAGKFGPPLSPAEMRNIRTSLALQGFNTKPGKFWSNLYGGPARRNPGTVTAGVASNFRGEAGARVADSLDAPLRPVASTLHSLDTAEIRFGPAHEPLQALRKAIGDEGLASLVKATQGMSKKDAIAYYAQRGLPAIVGALLVSQNLPQQERADETY